MAGKLTRMFQKRSREISIRLVIRDDAHSYRTSTVYFLSPFRLTQYLQRNPAGEDRQYSLEDQDLTEIDFSDLDLRRMNFSGAVLHDAVFTGAKLDDANIKGADLTGAVFEKGQIDSTKGTPKYGPEGPLTAERILKMRNKQPESPEKSPRL